MKMTCLLTTLFLLFFFLNIFCALDLPHHPPLSCWWSIVHSLLYISSQYKLSGSKQCSGGVDPICHHTSDGSRWTPVWDSWRKRRSAWFHPDGQMGFENDLWCHLEGRSKWDLSMVQKRFSALLASISKGIGWGTTSACCLIWNWLGSLTRMIPTKSKTWETALSIGLLAAFKSSWSRWSLGLRLRHWPFVQFDSGLSCFVCVLIIYCSNEPDKTSSVVYSLDLCVDLHVFCLARYFSNCGHLCCPILVIIQILISPEQYFYSKF